MTQVLSADSQDHRKYDKMSAQIQLKRHMGSFSLSYSTVKSWAERLKLPFRASDEAGQIAVHCRLLDSDVPLLFIPRPERDMLTVAVTLPFVVKTERFAAVMAALSTLNVRSYMGAWILNPERARSISRHAADAGHGIFRRCAALCRPRGVKFCRSDGSTFVFDCARRRFARDCRQDALCDVNARWRLPQKRADANRQATTTKITGFGGEMAGEFLSAAWAASAWVQAIRQDLIVVADNQALAAACADGGVAFDVVDVAGVNVLWPTRRAVARRAGAFQGASAAHSSSCSRDGTPKSAAARRGAAWMRPIRTSG